MDMTVEIFGQETYGKLALQKLAPVPETFRLYSAGWLGEKPKDWQVMKVTGADFRLAKAGREKGKLSIKVKGSDRTAYVTREEIRAYDDRVMQSQAGATGQSTEHSFQAAL